MSPGGLATLLAATLLIGVVPAVRSLDADSFCDFSRRLAAVSDQRERRAMTIAFLDEDRAYWVSINEPLDNVNDDLWLFDSVTNAQGDNLPETLLLAVFVANHCLSPHGGNVTTARSSSIPWLRRSSSTFVIWRC
ncbi:MAG: hypothetical protein AAGC71_12640 [Pseudomonadota bacterium]